MYLPFVYLATFLTMFVDKHFIHYDIDIDILFIKLSLTSLSVAFLIFYYMIIFFTIYTSLVVFMCVFFRKNIFVLRDENEDDIDEGDIDEGDVDTDEEYELKAYDTDVEDNIEEEDNINRMSKNIFIDDFLKDVNINRDEFDMMVNCIKNDEEDTIDNKIMDKIKNDTEIIKKLLENYKNVIDEDILRGLGYIILKHELKSNQNQLRVILESIPDIHTEINSDIDIDDSDSDDSDLDRDIVMSSIEDNMSNSMLEEIDSWTTINLEN